MLHVRTSNLPLSFLLQAQLTSKVGGRRKIIVVCGTPLNLMNYYVNEKGVFKEEVHQKFIPFA